MPTCLAGADKGVNWLRSQTWVLQAAAVGSDVGAGLGSFRPGSKPTRGEGQQSLASLETPGPKRSEEGLAWCGSRMSGGTGRLGTCGHLHRVLGWGLGRTSAWRGKRLAPPPRRGCPGWAQGFRPLSLRALGAAGVAASSEMGAVAWAGAPAAAGLAPEVGAATALPRAQVTVAAVGPQQCGAGPGRVFSCPVPVGSLGSPPANAGHGAGSLRPRPRGPGWDRCWTPVNF